jgi:hypothetical protein
MSGTRLNGTEKQLEYVTVSSQSLETTNQEEVNSRAAQSLHTTLRTTRRLLLFSVAIWSILELPVELILAQSQMESLASVAGRLIWVAFAFGAMYNKRLVNAIFLFLCATSSVVVAQALPMAYEASRPVFAVLVADLVLKALVLLVSLALNSAIGPSR